MGKPQKKMTKEEKLAKDRLRKREKYALIKNNPESDPLMNAEVVPSTSSQNTSAPLLKSDKRLRRIRYKYSLIVKKLNERMRKLEKEKDVLRKRRNITEKVCDTIEKKVNYLLIEIRPEKKEAVKRQLLFSETIKHNLQDSYKSLTKKDKRIFVDTLIKDDKLLRKYKLLQKLPFSRRQKKIAIDKKQILIKQIQNFFEEDTNSRFAAGRREFIKMKSIKKQKRYINDN
ncbi:hypothetical protein ACJJTC_000699 [Scirpophaga incertulas]